MHRVLLALAVGAALTAPASAKSFTAASIAASAGFTGTSASGQSVSHGVRVHRGLIGVPGGRMNDNRRHGRGPFVYPPEFYDANYDIDRSWDSNSFNDWWHDRPDRAYPRWVWHNHECSEDRMFWTGAGWRCTP